MTRILNFIHTPRVGFFLLDSSKENKNGISKSVATNANKKDGKVISWRAIYADLDEEGRRKRITWKSFPVKYKDDNGVNRTNSKNSVFQATVKKCEELKSISSDSLIDTSMTLMQFIEEHFEPHRKSTSVTNCLKPFKRYLRENGWANIRLNKVTKSFCRTNIVLK